jgi:tetratricopeptide (TPR) repeat protein/CHAT domain-containing protein
MSRLLFTLLLSFPYLISFAQTDFPALKQQFLDYRQADKQDSALFIARMMNQLAIKEQGDTSYWNSLSILFLGDTHDTNGDKDSALYFFQKAIELFKAFHPYNVDYADGLQGLGNLYFEIGDYKSAEAMYKQSLEIRMNVFGSDHPDAARSLNNLGNLYSDMGDYKSAEPMYKQSLEIRKKALGSDHPDVARSLNNLGNLYSDMGDYKSAETMYKESLEISKKVLGTEHLDVAKNSMNLAILYSDMGDNKSAETLIQQSLEIFKRALGPEHPEVAMGLNSLGILYSDMGDYKSAELFFEQSLKIYKKVSGWEHPDVAMCMNNLGGLYHLLGNYKSAELFFKQSLEIHEKALGGEHPDYAMSLNNLGNLYSDMGDYKSAETYFKQSLEIYKKALGGEHPDVAMCNRNFGSLYHLMGDYKSAESYYQISFQMNFLQLLTNFAWLSAIEKEAYWQKEKGFYFDINAFSSKASIELPSSTTLAYHASLISKSLLLETSRELDQAIARSSDENLKAQFAEMKQLRRIYSKMQSEGYDNNKVMEQYKSKADSLDKVLVNSLGEYAESKRKFEITWKDVQSNLSSDDAAIEFARYYDDKDNIYKYMALVVRPYYEYPKLVKLGEESNIRNAAQNKDFSSLYDLVWKDLDTLLVGVQKVYYSPVGELNKVSFSSLCFEAGDSVLQNIAQNRGVIISANNEKSQSCNAVLLDKYTLNQLTTTRYLADGTLNKSKAMNLCLALYGGINYDDIPITNDSISREISNKDYAFQLNLSKVNVHTDNLSTGGEKRSSSSSVEKMEYLPGTKEEVSNISKLVTNNHWKVLVRSEKKAGENEVKKELEINAPGVLHIATHGFVFPDEAKKETSKLSRTIENTYKASEDPMVRCGLMLSGSNISWTGNLQKMLEQTGEDGILTAAEVANLDLSKTKLVVLSACETGLGKIEGSEGTFGLKRGFKLAGVEQLIVSLWSVPDKETMELMTIFYSDLTKTLNPVASFEKAQKDMRNKYPMEPEKWAGFVLVR